MSAFCWFTYLKYSHKIGDIFWLLIAIIHEIFEPEIGSNPTTTNDLDPLLDHGSQGMILATKKPLDPLTLERHKMAHL